MHLSSHSAWGYVWGCTPHILIPHHWDVECDYMLPEVGKEARHSVSDCQLRFRFLGKDRCRKTSDPPFFLQTSMQRTLQKMAVAARTHLFSEAGLWKGTIPS